MRGLAWRRLPTADAGRTGGDGVVRVDSAIESPNVGDDGALLCFLVTLFASPLKSKGRLEAENAALRHQLNVLRRKVRGRAQFTNDARVFFVHLYRWFPTVLNAITIIRPDTLVRRHRAAS